MALSPSRRNLLRGLAGGTVAVAGAGATYVWSRDSPDVESGPLPTCTPTPSVTGAATPLTISTGDDSTGARKLLIDLWNQANPAVPVRIDPLPLSSSDQYTKIKVDALKADILNLDAPWVPRFAAEGLIRRLDDVDQSEQADFLPNAMSSCRYATAGGTETVWALPFNTDAGMLYMRRQTKPGPVPTRLVDILHTANSTFVGQLDAQNEAHDEAFTVNVLEHALSFKETILGKDGIPTTYSAAAWEEALAPLRNAWQTPGKIVRATDETDSLHKFESAKADWLRNWPLRYFDLEQDTSTGPRDSYVIVLPLRPAIIGGQNLAVTNGPRHADAIRVVRFLTSLDAQRLLALHGFAPTRTAVYNDPHLAKLMPHLAQIRQAVDGGRPRPIHPRYPELPKLLREHVQQYLNNGTSLNAFTAAMGQLFQ